MLNQQSSHGIIFFYFTAWSAVIPKYKKIAFLEKYKKFFQRKFVQGEFLNFLGSWLKIAPDRPYSLTSTTNTK